MSDETSRPVGGEALLKTLQALASPHRLKVLAALGSGEVHVSALARQVGLSRPLLQMHLSKLEGAGLVSSRHELSGEGRAMRFYRADFTRLEITARSIAEAAATLSGDTE